MRIKTALAVIFCTAPFISYSFGYLVTDLEYSSLQDLASYHVKTPSFCPVKEADRQSLFIKWKVAKKLLPLTVNIEIIEENLEKKKKTFCSSCPKGRYILNRSWKELDCGKGILAYRVTLLDKNGCLIREDRHKMWVCIHPKLQNAL